MIIKKQVFFSTTEGTPVRAPGAGRVQMKGNAKLLAVTELGKKKKKIHHTESNSTQHSRNTFCCGR